MTARPVAAAPPRLAQLGHLVGNTPLLVLRVTVRGRDVLVHAKHEVLNHTGSVKDRMALRILTEAYASGELSPGDTIAEATSGNTGIAFASLGRALGHPVRIFMPDWMSRERAMLLRGLGATLVPVSAEEGGFRGSIARAEAYAREHDGVFLPRQFESAANVRAHVEGTGPELLAQVRAAGREPTTFVAGVGTGGTVMGVGGFLHDALGEVAVHPLEPAESPTLRTGRKEGSHRIQGVGDEFVPSIVQLDRLDDVVDVHDGDAILMAQRMAAELGLSVGISSGANVVGALQLALGRGDDAVVATVLPDSGKKYVSTDLFREEPARDGYVTPLVERMRLEAVVPGPCLGLPGREGCAAAGHWGAAPQA